METATAYIMKPAARINQYFFVFVSGLKNLINKRAKENIRLTKPEIRIIKLVTVGILRVNSTFVRPHWSDPSKILG